MHPIDAPTQKEAPPIPATRTTLRTAERTASELQTNRMAVLQAVAVEWNGPRKEVAQALTAMRILRQVVAAANPIAAAVVARTAAMKVAQVMTAVRILRCGVRMATLPEEEAVVSTNGGSIGSSSASSSDGGTGVVAMRRADGNTSRRRRSGSLDKRQWQRRESYRGW